MTSSHRQRDFEQGWLGLTLLSGGMASDLGPIEEWTWVRGAPNFEGSRSKGPDATTQVID